MTNYLLIIPIFSKYATIIFKQTLGQKHFSALLIVLVKGVKK